jgi:hypothetical protein
MGLGLLAKFAACLAIGGRRGDDVEIRAARGALFAPDADSERLVLDSVLHRQDAYALRLVCKALRRELGARTTTLVVSEDRSSGTELLSVDLARAFPGLRVLVLRCSEYAEDRWMNPWPKRFAAFVKRNLGVLAQQLERLDLGLGEVLAYGTSPHLNASALRSIAQLTSLRSLSACAGDDLQPASWGALRALPQLTSLHVRVGDAAGHLQHIAAAAPQLQALSYKCSHGSLSAQGASSLASLASLASLHLDVCGGSEDSAVQLGNSLASLPRLAHLSLYLEHLGDQLLQALGQLTGLESLVLQGAAARQVQLEQLAPLQQLTRLDVAHVDDVDTHGAAALAQLGALRVLRAAFADPAAAAAAGVARLERAVVAFQCRPQRRDHGTVLAAGSSFRTDDARALNAFDTSQVHALELDDQAATLTGTHKGEYAHFVARALRHSPQLRALRLESRHALQPQVLQAVAACRQLTSLCLWVERHHLPEHPVAGGLAALAQGCKRLERLTLRGVKRLSVDMLPALLRLPSLRLLRLLGCSEAVGQEECRALASSLGVVHQLQVDVVVADWSCRAEWMMLELGKGWRDGEPPCAAGTRDATMC